MAKGGPEEFPKSGRRAEFLKSGPKSGRRAEFPKSEISEVRKCSPMVAEV